MEGQLWCPGPDRQNLEGLPVSRPTVGRPAWKQTWQTEARGSQERAGGPGGGRAAGRTRSPQRPAARLPESLPSGLDRGPTKRVTPMRPALPALSCCVVTASVALEVRPALTR